MSTGDLTEQLFFSLLSVVLEPSRNIKGSNVLFQSCFILKLTPITITQTISPSDFQDHSLILNFQFNWKASGSFCDGLGVV